ncbi:MAG TPA: CoA pyrophosphatase [Acidimicrobiales bacterium]|nr:CoA pyrophosphatase [Acidimicrobiales bacterium]
MVDLARVRAALAAARADRPPAAVPPGSRAAAVLIPLFEEDGEARVILTRRAATLSAHQGEMSFPGGTLGPREDELAAALREAEEEIGLPPAAVEVAGRLDRLVTATTGFVLTPFVGILDARPRLELRADEVEEAYDVPLSRLLDESVFREERWDGPAPDRPIYFFELEHDTVWGATARILYTLLELVTARSRRGM